MHSVARHEQQREHETEHQREERLRATWRAQTITAARILDSNGVRAEYMAALVQLLAAKRQALQLELLVMTRFHHERLLASGASPHEIESASK